MRSPECGDARDALKTAQEQVLNADIWRPMLERYAAATGLAVAVTDRSGRMVGEWINPRPLWTLLRSFAGTKPGDCPFCIRPIKAEECARRFLSGSSRDFAGGYAGLVHFTVPLKADGELVGFLLAGQVQSRYPEQLQLMQVAKDLNVSSQLLLQTARSEVPVSTRTLRVYWDLLESFADAFLTANLHRLVDAQRLAEMTKLRDLLAQRSDELAELHRRKDEFLATLSHELRTPLTAIIGWTRLLRSRPFEQKAAQTALEVIDRNAATQSRLVDDLLEISRIVTGKVRLNVERTDIVSVVTAAVNSVRPSAEIKNIDCQVLLDTGARFVMGDFARLQQVVWNLLTNAIKFTPPGGRVVVRLERVNSSARIVVSDTGEGIRREFLDSVFDRFTQADSSHTRHHGGLGLGLAIVRQIVDLHGGTVTVSSPGEGQGTIVQVLLPLAPVEEITTHAEKPAATTSRSRQDVNVARQDVNVKGLRVLIVEDEKDNRDLVSELIRSEDAVVVPVESVSSGLHVLNQQTFDVIIADIAMPNADGYQFIEEIRRLPAVKGGRTPAIAVTALASDVDRERLLRAGFQAYLPKPFAPNDLLALIEKVTSESRRRAS